jgi:tyrosyl-tRNA synthetase
VVKLLTDSGICTGTGEAKRLINGGGVSYEGEKICSIDAELDIADGSVLRGGKRKFIKIKKL